MTKIKFGDVITINPKEKLPKGTLAPKVAMEGIQPFTKYISSYVFEEYAGGAKFRNGDTLLARITPSLENGKTSIVSELPTDSVGFGSTEFLVFRATNQILPDYLYYLTTTPNFRDMAIKSMTGTSGRQRVQTDVVSDYELNLPSIKQQKLIVDKLLPLDAKIRLNNQINDNLVALAGTIWRSFDVYESKEVHDLFDVKYGKTMPKTQLTSTGVPVFGANGMIGYTDKAVMLPDYSVVITSRGSGSGDVQLMDKGVFVTNNLLTLESKHPQANWTTWQMLEQANIQGAVTGSAQPQLTIENFGRVVVNIPDKDTIKKFNGVSEKFEQIYWANKNEIKLLIETRDTILRKLIG